MRIKKISHSLAPDTKVTYGKVIYKGSGCHFSVGCTGEDRKLQKLGYVCVCVCVCVCVYCNIIYIYIYIYIYI